MDSLQALPCAGGATAAVRRTGPGLGGRGVREPSPSRENHGEILERYEENIGENIGKIHSRMEV